MRVIAGFLVVGLLALFVGLPLLSVYATVSTCGWRGLFVKCVIEAPTR